MELDTVELGVVIGARGRDIPAAKALEHVAGYGASLFLQPRNISNPVLALAVDMTARNVQEVVKKKGLPWSTCKGFDTFTPIGCVVARLAAAALPSLF